MFRLLRRLFLVLGFFTFLGVLGVGVAVTVLWWQDRQWQKEMQKEQVSSLHR